MENNNSLNNLPPFYVGQKVVYITGISMPKNSIHTVIGMLKNTCGCWSVDIGKRSKPNELFNGYFCEDCKSVIIKSDDGCPIDYFDYKSFAPIQEAKFPLISLSKVIEKEKQLVSAN